MDAESLAFVDITQAAHRRGYQRVAGAALCWAASGVAAKAIFGQRPISPAVLVEWRVLGSFVLLALIIAFTAPAELRIRSRDLPFFLIYGSVGQAMVQITYFTAIREGNVSTAIFLQYLAPLLTAVYTVAWARQRPPAGLTANLVLALAGSALLLLGGGGGLSTSPLGLAAGLASAGFMSFYTVFGARGVGMYSSRTVLLYTLGVACLFLAPAAQPWRVASLGWAPADWLFVAYMAVFGTLLPFSLFLSGLRHISPMQASLTAMLEPVMATFGAWLVLHERLSGLQVTGGLLIIVAIVRLQLARSRGRSQPIATA